MQFVKTLAALLISCATVAACAEETKQPLQIQSKKIPLSLNDEHVTSIGQLLHLGSLRLTSPDKSFGGISGLIVSADGKTFLAITDSSHWLTGELQYSGKKLIGMTGKEIAPLRDLSGKPLRGKKGDAEGLTGSLTANVYVSFEGDHRIWRYDFGKDGLDATPVAVETPVDLEKAPGNGGLEAITLLSDGKMLAVTESFEDSNGNGKAWLLDLKLKAHAPLAIKKRKPFDVTDIRQLANGDLIMLERRFSPVGGVGFGIRRFPAAMLKSTDIIDGQIIADASMSVQIDNMEGLAIRKGANDETLVYIISDDNFNAPLQQNLLMLFELKNDSTTP